MDGLLQSATGWIIAGMFAMAGGAIAIWALFGDRSRGRRRCPRCWYDMSGIAGSLRCPECGHQASAMQETLRTRRRKIPATIGFVIAVCLPSVMLYEHAARSGWIYLVLPKWKVLSSTQVQGFSVQFLEVRNPNAKDWSRKLRIRRGGDTVLKLPGFYFTVGAPVTSNNVTKTIGLGDDITGDGRPDLVVIEDSGGS